MSNARLSRQITCDSHWRSIFCYQHQLWRERHPNIHCKCNNESILGDRIFPWLGESFPWWGDHKLHISQLFVGSQNTYNLPHNIHVHEHCKRLFLGGLDHKNNKWNSSYGTSFPWLDMLGLHQSLSLHKCGICLKWGNLHRLIDSSCKHAWYFLLNETKY